MPSSRTSTLRLASGWIGAALHVVSGRLVHVAAVLLQRHQLRLVLEIIQHPHAVPVGKVEPRQPPAACASSSPPSPSPLPIHGPRIGRSGRLLASRLGMAMRELLRRRPVHQADRQLLPGPIALGRDKAHPVALDLPPPHLLVAAIGQDEPMNAGDLRRVSRRFCLRERRHRQNQSPPQIRLLLCAPFLSPSLDVPQLGKSAPQTPLPNPPSLCDT